MRRLQDFVAAQDAIGYQGILDELHAGQKRRHWMWFVFPQLAGLGYSETAQDYAIPNLAEAQAYLQHPVLGARLLECVSVLNCLEGRTAQQIFGMPDTLKFCSSLTLFELIAGADSVFAVALEKYFAGERDALTLGLAGLNKNAAE